jgi:hypothetical protein
LETKENFVDKSFLAIQRVMHTNPSFTFAGLQGLGLLSGEGQAATLQTGVSDVEC